jgi:hypothetical protein
MNRSETLDFVVMGSDEPLSVRPERLVVAGYTARDEASVARHIEELAAIGVPPPPAVPMFYDLDPALLSTDAHVEVGEAATDGLDRRRRPPRLRARRGRRPPRPGLTQSLHHGGGYLSPDALHHVDHAGTPGRGDA